MLATEIPESKMVMGIPEALDREIPKVPEGDEHGGCMPRLEYVGPEIGEKDGKLKLHEDQGWS